MKDSQTLTADSQPKWVYATPWMTTNWSMYRPSHPFGSRGSKCLLSEVATGWKAGSGQLATPEFIYEESLLSSWWDTLYTGSARLQPGQLYCFNSETIWSQRKEMRVVVTHHTLRDVHYKLFNLHSFHLGLLLAPQQVNHFPIGMSSERTVSNFII